MNSRLVHYLIIIIGLILIVNTLVAIFDLWRMGDRVIVQEQEVGEMTAKNAQLEQSIAQAQSEAYLEKAARDRLNMVKPGDYVVMMPATGNASQSAAPLDPRPNWEKWKEVIF